MKINKRFFILNIIIVLAVIVTATLVLSVGNKYDIHTHYYTDAKTPDNIQLKCNKDGIISVNDIKIENREVVVSVSSKGKGAVNCEVLVYPENEAVDESYAVTSHISLYVTTQGVIIETTTGNLNFTGYRAVFVEILSILVLLIVFMCYSFIDCKREAEFSYTMVAYGGLTLFCSILFAFIVYKMLNNVVNSFSDFAYLVHESGIYFLLSMIPLMLIMAISVSVSNISLIRHEGFRYVNALGIAASILWFLGTLFSFNTAELFFYITKNSVLTNLTYNIHTILVYILCYFECMIISTSLCAYLASRYKPPYDKDYIIILGCAIRDDGSLTPLLKGRANSALNFEKEQYEKTGKHAMFVPSGGQGEDEVISEGEAIKRYLIEQGVPEERILSENKSVNTYQNFKYSYEVIKNDTDSPENKNIAFATTNYHIFRGYILSTRNGFRAMGISAKTKWYFFPNAFLRECVGMLYDQKSRHLMFIVLTVLFFIFI